MELYEKITETVGDDAYFQNKLQNKAIDSMIHFSNTYEQVLRFIRNYAALLLK